MERDFRIEEVASLTGLTKNYIYTCLKRMPDIFSGVVSTGQHNAKIFREEAIGLFREVGRLKKERLWSLGQIYSHMLTTRTRDRGLPEGSARSDQARSSEEYEQRVEKLENEVTALRSALECRELELMDQRRRSDAIILELTSQLRSLRETLSFLQTAFSPGQASSQGTGKGLFEVVARGAEGSSRSLGRNGDGQGEGFGAMGGTSATAAPERDKARTDIRG